MKQSSIDIKLAKTPNDFEEAKSLILDYTKWLGMDLSFQNFDEEMNTLPEMYAEPVGGLLLASIDERYAGVAGIRKYSGDDCELKRMFVIDEFRNHGIGKALLTKAIDLAKSLGYKKVKLDTADFMVAAVKLYQMNGFVEIPAYRYNPLESARYFELTLTK